jgi:hypothetical protein
MADELVSPVARGTRGHACGRARRAPDLLLAKQDERDPLLRSIHEPSRVQEPVEHAGKKSPRCFSSPSRPGPFEEPATVKTPALPGDTCSTQAAWVTSLIVPSFPKRTL